MQWKTNKRIWNHVYKAIVQVWYIEIWTWLRGFLVIFLYLVWFSLWFGVVKNCNFDPKASESWQNFNISLSQHTEVELRQTESFRNFFNEDPGHGLTERLHVDNYQPRIPRAPFLCECCYNAPQYGEHGEHCECYFAIFTQYRQWLRELKTLRRWKWSAIVSNMHWLDYNI